MDHLVFAYRANVSFVSFPRGVLPPIHTLSYFLAYYKLDVALVVFRTVADGFVKVWLLDLDSLQEVALEGGGEYGLGLDVGVKVVADFGVLDGRLVDIGEGSWNEMPLVVLVEIFVECDV